MSRRTLNPRSRRLRPAVTPGPGYEAWLEAELFEVPPTPTDTTAPVIVMALVGV